MDNELKLILVSPQYGLCQAWDKRFADLPNVEIVSGTFQSLPEFDCMVSAANSFGLMDGGVDLAIIRFFGQALMTRVQQRILGDYLGEQPIGTSMIVPTDHARHPYLAHTPTMRIPMEIQHTDNVYLAMWAMLLAVRRHNLGETRPIRTIACPELGTGTFSTHPARLIGVWPMNGKTASNMAGILVSVSHQEWMGSKYCPINKTRKQGQCNLTCPFSII